MGAWVKWLAVLGLMLSGAVGAVPPDSQEYRISAGDILKITVFKNPDLTEDLRVSEGGGISFPLIGTVDIAHLTLPEAERKIAKLLRDGGFVLDPQVNILLTQALGNQVAVLGQVNRPGRYSIDTAGGHLSGVLAAAGGVALAGADLVIVTGSRDGKPFRREIDVVQMSSNPSTDDITLDDGDTVFVNRAPLFYIYGQVQRPGQLRLERGMTVMQALASGGGVTGKGTARGIVVHRRDAKGKLVKIHPKLSDGVQDEDVIYVKERLF